MMMNPANDSISRSIIPSIISSEMQSITNLHMQFSLAQLKHEFEDIVLNPKHHYTAWISRAQSLSATDTTTNTLYSDDYTDVYTLLSKQDIDALHGIASMLRSTDYLPDCAQIYIDQRKGVVNLIWCRLFHKVNVKEVAGKDYTQVINEKIQWWIQAANIFIKHVFVKEKMFYDEIFGGMDSDADYYVRIVRKSAINLFEFADSLVSNPRFPQSLEILLPLYQEILDQIPAMDLIFKKDSSMVAKNIHGRATGLLFKIAEYLKKIIISSELQVLQEESMAVTPGGKVHFITEYVIRYVDLISVHKNSITDLTTSLELHATRMIESLLHNLKKKSIFYKNEALGHLFMLNNVNHIAQNIKMLEIVDENLRTKLLETVEKEMTDFSRTSWSKVLQCLDIEKSKSLSFSWVFGKSVKKKLKAFNQMFEDVVRVESKWVVQDQKLRDKLQQSIIDKLIPAYKAFLEEYSFHIEKLHHHERYIKYNETDLENRILSLFYCK